MCFQQYHIYVQSLTLNSAGVKGPKPATADKPATNGAATRGGRATRGRGRRGRNAGRAKPKTADELDAEMVDYFDPSNTNGAGNATAAANGTAQPAGDAGMDEIAVSISPLELLTNHTDSNSTVSDKLRTVLVEPTSPRFSQKNAPFPFLHLTKRLLRMVLGVLTTPNLHQLVMIAAAQAF